jgi:hypothetical protein
MTKPPYPTEALRKVNCRYFSDDGYCSVREEELQSLFDSIKYWLTPRKCSEVPPQVPCLARAYDWDYWILLENDQGDEYGFADSYSVPKDKVTHWLPLPPAPEET